MLTIMTPYLQVAYCFFNTMFTPTIVLSCWDFCLKNPQIAVSTIKVSNGGA